MARLTFILIFGIYVQLVLTASNCIHRDYGFGGTVCVCNSTYCDNPDPLPRLTNTEYVLYVSSLDGLRFNLTKRNFDEAQEIGNLQLIINSSLVHQEILGFGASFTDAAGINLASLSENAQNLLLQSYFSPEGNAYTLARTPIGGSDFSDHPYTYADNGPDLSLQNFNLTIEDYLYKIPFIKKAVALTESKLRLMAAAWTAPPWMKTNDNYTGVGSLKEEYYALWSDYHLKFLEEYDKEGLNFWMISTGNEPLNGDVPLFPFNCMGWTPKNQRVWVSQNIGPALRNSKFNKTSIIGYDDQRFELPWWLNILFEEEDDRPFIEGIGVHWYWDKVAPLSLLDKAHDAHPSKFILATEASYVPQNDDQAVFLGSWERGQGYAKSIIDDLKHHVAGWIDWNLALDEDGGPNWAGNVVDSAIIINKTSDEFYKQPMYYALGHTSKFVPPGSYKIELNGDNDEVMAVAFKTPTESIVIMILNMKSVEESITVSGMPTTANFNLPPNSIATFICNLY